MSIEKQKTKTLNVDERVHRRLKVIATENGVSVFYLTNLILTGYFQQYDQVRQEQNGTSN